MLQSLSNPKKVALYITIFLVVLFIVISMGQDDPKSASFGNPRSAVPSSQNATETATTDAASVVSSAQRTQIEYTTRADDAFDRESTAVYLSQGQKALLPATTQQISAAEKTALFVKFMGMMNPLLQNTSQAITKTNFEYLLRESERLKNENYLMLNEYAIVQERLLRSQYSGTELQSKLQTMQTSVAQSRERLLAQNDPRKDPSYLIYAAKEAQILSEANAMTRFPNGMTKEAYIVYRLEQISQ